MIAINSSIYQFGKKPFTFQEFIKLTKYKKGYGRNLITQLKKEQILLTIPAEGDKRERCYKLNWKTIRQLIIAGGTEKQLIIKSLPISNYTSEYVALKNFEVIDHDLDLLHLTQRVYRKRMDPDVVLTNVGPPKQVITHEVS